MNSYFLDIDPETAADSSAPYAVLPIPYERTVSFGTGTASGPEAILRASHETEDFDEELKIPLDLKVQTLDALNFNNLEDNDAINLIEETAVSLMKDGRFLLSLGGEHTISAPLIRAAKNIYSEISVLHIDSHLDLRDQYMDSKLSHACVMRRVKESNIPVVFTGIRSCSAEEYSYAKTNSLPIYWARDIYSDPEDKWIDDITNTLSNKVYITLDIDALDPSIAPGTGTPEPGGLNWYKICKLLRKVFETKEVVSADIVEVAPIPGSQVTEFVAARLGAKMLTYKSSV